MPLSSWLIGTVESDVADTITITVAGGTGAVGVVVPAGPLYLQDSNSALSYASALATAINTQCVDITACSIRLLENRCIQIVFTAAGNVTVNWGSNTDLRDILGFTGTLSGATSYTATLISSRIWVPGLTEIGRARLGRVGVPVQDTQVGGGGGATRPAMTTHNRRETNALEWRAVDNARVWVTEAGGEHIAFWTDVLTEGRQFLHFRATNEDATSTTAITLTSGNRLGPYHWNPPSGAVEYDYDRSIQHVEKRNNVKIPVVVVRELT
jgi:hypothetical protein